MAESIKNLIFSSLMKKRYQTYIKKADVHSMEPKIPLKSGYG